MANELSKDDVSKLNAECVKQGIEFMASVFDLERLQWVLDLGVKRVKIASRSINDQQLIEASVESWKRSNHIFRSLEWKYSSVSAT